MKQNVRNAIWYLLTLTGVIYTIVIFSCIQGAPSWGWAVTIVLLALQLTGLVYYIHRKPETAEKGILKAFLVLLRLSAIGIVIWFCLANYSLAGQYHNRIQPTEAQSDADNITVIQTDLLYIIKPNYTSVDFTTSRPSRSEKDIVFCAGATFQKRHNLFLDRSEIINGHVEKGRFYEGYKEKGYGAFTYYDGRYHFVNEDEADAEMQRAAERNGMGFRQFLVIDNGEIQKIPIQRYRCYRLLADKDGELMIIDSRSHITFSDFVDAVLEYGVDHAMYMDMGRGWNYSWYRNNEGKAITLIGLPWPFSHNWIVFRK